MEYLLTLTDLNAFLQHFLGNRKSSIGHLLIVDENAALLNQLTGLLVGGSQAAQNHQIQKTDLAVHQLVGSDFGGGHVGIVAVAGKQSLGSGFGLLLVCDTEQEVNFLLCRPVAYLGGGLSAYRQQREKEKVNEGLSKACRNVAVSGSKDGNEHLNLINLSTGQCP